MRNRISVHDLEFADLSAGKVFGPFDCPSGDELREALLRFARHYPDNHLFATVEHTRLGGARWGRHTEAELERLCAAMVSEIDADGRDPDDLLRRVTDHSLAHEMAHYWVGNGFLASTRSHLLGDTAFSHVTPLIIRVALGEPVPTLPADVTDRMPLTRAALSHFGRRPIRLVDALRAPRPKVGHSPESFALPEWSFTSVGRTASADVVAAVRAWRDTSRPSASVANTWCAAIRGAFESAGVQFASPGFHVLVNARRYLPPGMTVNGNFATAIYVEPADPLDPASVDETVRRDLDNGRPLLAMAVSGLKQAVPHRSSPGAASIITDRRPSLTISYVGRREAFEPLRADRQNIVHYSASRPDGPSGVTVICSLTHGRMSLTASFCEAVVPRGRVVQALELATKDPMSFLAT